MQRLIALILAGCSSICASLDVPATPRREAVVYHDNLDHWVLGQQASLAINGVLTAETDYNNLAEPVAIRSFGKITRTLTYRNDGTVASVSDGMGNITELSDWKRGIPQSLKHPSTPETPGGALQSAVVNNEGRIVSTTDANGISTNYAYDSMGRLSQIQYPSNDSTLWNATTLSFRQVGSSEWGIPSGHWQQVITTGNGRKITYFDALWRPLLVREYDVANESGTQRFQRYAYDYAGRVTFASYPSASGSPTAGTWTEHDALGRPISVSQDSEHGLLTTTTEYLSGFRTRATDAKGNQTVTTYQAFDEPTYEFPVVIDAPAGRYTEITRDAFGKPLSITRSGPEE